MMNALLHERNIPDASHHGKAITLKSVATERLRAEQIMLPTMDGLCFEKIKHIAYLEASGNYTVLHFIDSRQVLVCKTLGDVEQLLSSGAFVRIHRSHTIHLRHIKKYTRGKGGHVLLQNGVTLAVSSGQRENFLITLKKYFT
ncbi:MAG: LytTR family transcriptional regulator [Lewinellaceae bacterium]|nr:LytTR family transcriptional regulator [Lewinellaceae bacterium]